MKNIEITVMKKVAYADGMPTIVCGNNDYTLSFEFDDEWNDEQNKVARFSFVKNGLKSFIDVPIENNTCKVPVLLGIGLVRVGVYAGNLRTTTGAKIKCHKSILCDDADTMDEPFKNLYEQLMGNIAELEKGTIKIVENVNLSTCESGVYFTNTIKYKIPFYHQSMTEVMPCKALLIVEKTDVGIHFQWTCSVCTITGLSNAEGKFENEFTRYSFENINSALSKENIVTEFDIEETFEDTQIYNANAVNMFGNMMGETVEAISRMFEEHRTAINELGKKVEALESQAVVIDEISLLVGGAE